MTNFQRNRLTRPGNRRRWYVAKQLEEAKHDPEDSDHYTMPQESHKERNSKDCGFSPFHRRSHLRFLPEAAHGLSVLELGTGESFSLLCLSTMLLLPLMAVYFSSVCSRNLRKKSPSQRHSSLVVIVGTANSERMQETLISQCSSPAFVMMHGNMGSEVGDRSIAFKRSEQWLTVL
ncbi:Protein Ycf2 [Trichinella pseudospiralis]